MMVRWSGEVYVKVRLGSNLKNILSLTLVDVKLVHVSFKVLQSVSSTIVLRG